MAIFVTHDEIDQNEDQLTKLNQNLDTVKQLLGASELGSEVISSGSITPDVAAFTIDTEASASSDDLTNILTTNLHPGAIIAVSPLNESRSVTVKNEAGGAGQISLSEGLDKILAFGSWLLLGRDGANWKEFRLQSTGSDSGGVDYAPQTIVTCAKGNRPPDWTADDCDAPSATLVSGDFIPHSTYWGPCGVASASSENSTYYAWELFDDNSSTDWQSAANSYSSGVGDESIYYNHHNDREITSIEIQANATSSHHPETIEVYVDDVLEKTFSGLTYPGSGNWTTLTLDAPVTGKEVRLRITHTLATSGGTVCGLFGVKFNYTDISTGNVQIESGLQCAYADSGVVKLSETLASAQTLDLSSEADGNYFVYADFNEDGSYSGFGYTVTAPRFNNQREDATGDFYSIPEATMYDSSDTAIRRMYIGEVEVESGEIVDVFSYGESVTSTYFVNYGDFVGTLNEYLMRHPFGQALSEVVVEVWVGGTTNDWVRTFNFYSSTSSNFSGVHTKRVTTDQLVEIPTFEVLTNNRVDGESLSTADCRIVVTRRF